MQKMRSTKKAPHIPKAIVPIAVIVVIGIILAVYLGAPSQKELKLSSKLPSKTSTKPDVFLILLIFNFLLYIIPWTTYFIAEHSAFLGSPILQCGESIKSANFCPVFNHA